MSVFTEIIAGNIPGRFVYADETCVVFATIEPINYGHMLVVPRAEVSRFTELSEQTFAHISVVAQRVGRAQERAFDISRAMTMIAANAMHDVPAERMDEDTEKVRVALRELGFGESVPEDMYKLA